MFSQLQLSIWRLTTWTQVFERKTQLQLSFSQDLLHKPRCFIDCNWVFDDRRTVWAQWDWIQALWNPRAHLKFEYFGVESLLEKFPRFYRGCRVSLSVARVRIKIDTRLNDLSISGTVKSHNLIQNRWISPLLGIEWKFKVSETFYSPINWLIHVIHSDSSYKTRRYDGSARA
mgnify:CR=1 FL=1